jgi:hypothetical protein
MSVLSNAVNNLSASLKTIGGEALTYRRGNDSLDVVGVPVKTRHDEYGDEVVSFTARERDWIFWADDLTLSGERWEPTRGDEIDWFDAQGAKHTYQVLPRSGDRCFRHTDPTMSMLRVYTVESLANSE